jgi:CheY-like chemotaxis protein
MSRSPDTFQVAGMRSLGAACHPGHMRCFMVDDSQDYLDAAGSVLTSEGVEVVGTAGTSYEALERVGRLRPDVVLVDINLGTESGFALARALNEAPASARTPVILISTHAEDDYAELIEASPAVGFLSKSSVSLGGIRRLLAART